MKINNFYSPIGHRWYVEDKFTARRASLCQMSADGSYNLCRLCISVAMGFRDNKMLYGLYMLFVMKLSPMRLGASVMWPEIPLCVVQVTCSHVGYILHIDTSGVTISRIPRTGYLQARGAPTMITR